MVGTIARHLGRNLIAYVALFVALGGTATAAAVIARNSITTVHVKNGSLLAVDFKRGQLPAGQQGPQGPPGPAGPAGPGGGAAVLWGQFQANGTLVAGNGITLAQRGGGGEVQITLNRDISRYAYVATLARNNGTDPGPVANVEAIDATRVRVVRTLNQQGVDAPFSLAVFC